MITKSCLVLAASLVLCVQARVAPPPVLKEAPQEVLFRDQKQFNLECVVEGSIVTYQWTKDGKPYKPSGKVEQKENKLIFSEPKVEDEGAYQCFGVSDLGKASMRPISVKRAYLNAPKVTPQTTTPIEGKPFKLACAIPDAYPKPTIQWQKKTKEGKAEDVSDERVTIGPNGDLYFTNATQADVSKGFTYECVAKSPAVEGPVTLASHSVAPLKPNPSPDSEVVQLYVTPDRYTLEAGQEVFLYCIYGGSPFPYPSWSKDGVDVNNKPGDRVTAYNRSKGKRLLIREVLLEDQGEYTCVLNNKVGKEQKYVFHVDVVSAPKYLKKPEKRMEAKQGTDVFIPCEVQAKPAAKTTWTLNAEALKNSRAKADAKGLTISKVKTGDSGYYGCGAQNQHGQNYTETLLVVTA